MGCDPFEVGNHIFGHSHGDRDHCAVGAEAGFQFIDFHSVFVRPEGGSGDEESAHLADQNLGGVGNLIAVCFMDFSIDTKRGVDALLVFTMASFVYKAHGLGPGRPTACAFSTPR
jgi:hypothetical protein